MIRTRNRASAPAGRENAAPSPAPPVDLDGALARALAALDRVLALALEKQAQALGPASLLDPWRGMHIDRSDVQRILATPPAPFGLSAGVPPEAGVATLLAAVMREVPTVGRMAAALPLDDLDLAGLLLALAPDLDLRYERVYGYLQDDITRRRPALDLIANLLARDGAERLRVCARFGEWQPLARHGILHAEEAHQPPPLGRAWRVDDAWRDYITGAAPSAAPLGACARFVDASTALDPLVVPAALASALDDVLARTATFRLLLHGRHGVGKFALARAIARARDHRLLVVDLRDAAAPWDLRRQVAACDRAAVLGSALLYLHGLGRLEQRDPQLVRALMDALSESSGSVILACVTPLPTAQSAAVPLVRLELEPPGAEGRGLVWRDALDSRGLAATEPDLIRVAHLFSLTASQIAQACSELGASAGVRGAEVSYAQLAAAARDQSGAELARLAHRIVPRADFDSLVVPPEVLAQLHELCARLATREMVSREWAGGSVHARGAGVTALFAGPSGTGKTLSAEAVARELGYDLYRIDLSGIVSKYIGETEKNLDRVFAAAEHANAVLFFDEADALFGKRSEVKDAHDRYANIEIAYLLQKMEQFDGLAILATNLKQNLDEAFARRLTFTVSFPFPEEPERRRLWDRLWPARAPRAADVDLAWFAREYRMSGGNIRNTVMAAAHLAAADGQVITRQHLLHATRREFQKLGKNIVPPAEERRP
jgi:AAA+ superfamily predicted ATPase